MSVLHTQVSTSPRLSIDASHQLRGPQCSPCECRSLLHFCIQETLTSSLNSSKISPHSLLPIRAWRNLYSTPKQPVIASSVLMSKFIIFFSFDFPGNEEAGNMESWNIWQPSLWQPPLLLAGLHLLGHGPRCPWMGHRNPTVREAPRLLPTAPSHSFLPVAVLHLWCTPLP